MYFAHNFFNQPLNFHRGDYCLGCVNGLAQPADYFIAWKWFLQNLNKFSFIGGAVRIIANLKKLVARSQSKCCDDVATLCDWCCSKSEEHMRAFGSFGKN